MTPRFTVSILTYTALPQAKACIASVLRSTVPFNLILTANGNTAAAEYFTALAKEHAFITVVVNEKNQGFIDPNRHALELCETELFVMLNDDAILPPDGLGKLAAPFDRFPKAALSGPRGDFQTLLPNFHGTKGRDFEYLNGACLCCKTEIVRKHGLFDPALKWAYGEDSDLSLRMREKGYTLHHADFILQHEVAATSKHVPEVRKNTAANHQYLINRWSHYLKCRKMDYPIVVKRAGAYGDVLLTTPIIRALRERYPLSPIWVETVCPQIFTHNPHVANLQTRIATGFDHRIFNLNGSYEATPARHFVLAYAEKCGLSAIDDRTELYIPEIDHQKAARLMPDGTRWVAMHCGPSTWRSKEWPVERFSAVSAYLQSEGFKIVLVGSAGGKHVQHDLDERGQTTIQGMGAIIKRAQLFIGLDSLPLHVAQCVGTPVIGLFGITDPKYILTSGSPSFSVCGTTPSFGQRHRVANQTHVDDGGAAMNSIGVDMVKAQIALALNATPA